MIGFQELVDAVSGATGWPASDLRNRGLAVRAAGLIPVGKAGRGPSIRPHLTSEHAAAFLLGVMVSVPMNRCAGAVSRCLQLERTGAREVMQILPELVDADYGREHPEAAVHEVMPGGISTLIDAFAEEERLRAIEAALFERVPLPCELASLSVTTFERTFAASIRLRFHPVEEGRNPQSVEFWFIEPEERHAPTGAEVGFGARTVTMPGAIFAILANLLNDRPAEPLPWQLFGSPRVAWLNAA